MNKLMAYVPDDLKTDLGWDPAFDAGRLGLFPLKIVGFQKKRPMGGNPINIDIKKATIQERSEDQNLFVPHTPYEKWLNNCHKEILSKENIETAYQLSQMLTVDAPVTVDGIVPEMNSFALVNHKSIKEAFSNHCENKFGIEITKYLIDAEPPVSMLALLSKNIPIVKLTVKIENIIINNQLSEKTLPEKTIDNLIKSGSNRIKFIGNIWKGKTFSIKTFDEFNTQEKIEIIKYLLLTEYIKKNLMISLLQQNKDIFYKFLSLHETKEFVSKILRFIRFSRTSIHLIE